MLLEEFQYTSHPFTIHAPRSSYFSVSGTWRRCAPINFSIHLQRNICFPPRCCIDTVFELRCAPYTQASPVCNTSPQYICSLSLRICECSWNMYVSHIYAPQHWPVLFIVIRQHSRSALRATVSIATGQLTSCGWSLIQLHLCTIIQGDKNAAEIFITPGSQMTHLYSPLYSSWTFACNRS